MFIDKLLLQVQQTAIKSIINISVDCRIAVSTLRGAIMVTHFRGLID